MSEFALFRFMSSNMLTLEEQQHKDEIVSLTSKALDDNGIECDTKISKMSEEQPMEILEQVRGSFEIKRRMRKIKIRKSSLTLPYNSR
jgi:ribosome maturation protein Sdo1